MGTGWRRSKRDWWRTELQADSQRVMGLQRAGSRQRAWGKEAAVDMQRVGQTAGGVQTESQTVFGQTAGGEHKGRQRAEGRQADI